MLDPHYLSTYRNESQKRLPQDSISPCYDNPIPYPDAFLGSAHVLSGWFHYYSSLSQESYAYNKHKHILAPQATNFAVQISLHT